MRSEALKASESETNLENFQNRHLKFDIEQREEGKFRQTKVIQRSALLSTKLIFIEKVHDDVGFEL